MLILKVLLVLYQSQPNAQAQSPSAQTGSAPPITLIFFATSVVILIRKRGGLSSPSQRHSLESLRGQSGLGPFISGSRTFTERLTDPTGPSFHWVTTADFTF